MQDFWSSFFDCRQRPVWAKTASLKSLGTLFHALALRSKSLFDLFIRIAHEVGAVAGFPVEPAKAHSQVVVIALVR